MPVWPFGRWKARRPMSGGTTSVDPHAPGPPATDPRHNAPTSASADGRSGREVLCPAGGREQVTVAPSRVEPVVVASTRCDTISALHDDADDMAHDLRPPSGTRARLQKKKRASGEGPSRKKSTGHDKVKDDNGTREVETRAMSASIPIRRPAPQSGNAIRRDTIKARPGVGRHFDPDNTPLSDRSLPVAHSTRSSVTDGSQMFSNSVKLSRLNIFAPRPTIRYSNSSLAHEWHYTAGRAINTSSRSNSQRRRSLHISKDALKDSKTIDDLADDMDAGAIRQLMERDQRRKERKRIADEECLRRRLERRAKMQDGPTILHPAAAVHPPQICPDPAGLTHEPTSAAVQPPFDNRHSSVSRRGSSRISGYGGGGSRWWSGFRRRPSVLLKRSSIDPTTDALAPLNVSLSSTSRDSMAYQGPSPAHLAEDPARRLSGTPVRTLSRFREDLPERQLPSPPSSRVQSPEPGLDRAPAAHSAGWAWLPETSGARHRIESPTFLKDGGSDRYRTDSPINPTGRTSGLMSTSLASIDSEGSWLSGKPVKRGSRAMRSSYGSSFRRPREDWDPSYEELGIPDDEYFRRLTPAPDEAWNTIAYDMQRKASSVALASHVDAGVEVEEEEDKAPAPEDTVMRDSIVRKPTVVHRQSRAKSQEGLLSIFHDEAMRGLAKHHASEVDMPSGSTPSRPPNAKEKAGTIL